MAEVREYRWSLPGPRKRYLFEVEPGLLTSFQLTFYPAELTGTLVIRKWFKDKTLPQRIANALLARESGKVYLTMAIVQSYTHATCNLLLDKDVSVEFIPDGDWRHHRNIPDFTMNLVLGVSEWK